MAGAVSAFLAVGLRSPECAENRKRAAQRSEQERQAAPRRRRGALGEEGWSPGMREKERAIRVQTPRGVGVGRKMEKRERKNGRKRGWKRERGRREHLGVRERREGARGPAPEPREVQGGALRTGGRAP